MNNIDNLKGVITPVVTMFENQKFSSEKMGNVIDFLINNNVNGLLFLGTAGEATHMEKDMRLEVIEYCIKKTNHRVPTIVGISARSIQECISYAEHAKDQGADAVILVNPSYIKYSDDGIFNFYSAVASKIDLPILLYNFPSLTGQRISPEVVLRLASTYSNIIGIKDTTDSASSTREYITTVKSKIPSFKVFAGFDEYLLNTLFLGGDGAIPGTSNFAPQFTTQLYSAFLKQDYSAMLENHQKIAKLCEIYTLHSPFFPVVKRAMLMNHIDVSTEALLPCTPISNQTINLLTNLLKKI
ncbi:hypothetical protein QV08_02950 [Gallibacterium salpingitidis]|uniref:Dihydrodipicolinate synthase n=1 Tax=Gallibacterium salpingitidis TaxID=505341 RepID=A0AB36E246_9PAST|nr:dihydrodipicolinate synthase family protein [Gallibacterium salpingitidis]OBX09040.1 hypothetical protein QV08_02950 [Gallibacterium salpingitidis]OBX10160.1 hypothetical protein QV09_06950 [Gallibacterium salpingitidis]